jgi:predicted RNase H-like nuclease
MPVAGVDGCRGGWLIAITEIGTNGAISRPKLEVVEAFGAVLTRRWGAIDIAIGLLDDLTPGGRVCDREARSLLGPV